MNDQIDEMILNIPSDFKFLGAVDAAIQDLAREFAFSQDAINDVSTALIEACSNAIEHGNKMDARMKVGIVLKPEDMKLQVTVHDEGNGIGKVKTPRIEDKIEGKDKPRGWGIFLIKNLVDEVKFESTPEGGNLVRMTVCAD